MENKPLYHDGQVYQFWQTFGFGLAYQNEQEILLVDEKGRVVVTIKKGSYLKRHEITK